MKNNTLKQIYLLTSSAIALLYAAFFSTKNRVVSSAREYRSLDRKDEWTVKGELIDVGTEEGCMDREGGKDNGDRVVEEWR